MHKITKLQFAGFRRLHDLRLDMRPLMVMIGANGVGKTSVLDAVALLSVSAEGNLNETLNLHGGVTELSTRGHAKRIALEAEMDCPGHEPLEYQLELESTGQGYAISAERLSQERQGGQYSQPFKHIESHYADVRYFDAENSALVRPNWEYNPLESSLSQVPKMFKQPEEFRRTLGSVTQYHVLDVGPRAPVKLPQQLRPALSPGENGEDLVSFLYNLRESERDRYEILEDTLRAAYPGFESLNFPSPAAGMLSLTWKEQYFRDPLYAHQLSEGTLRFLWLIALLQSLRPSTITMIDEPEVSLHPELLSLLAELFREVARANRTQLIIATHSDRLIRFLNPQEVVVMDVNEDGTAGAQWADTLDLDQWLQEYGLDEIWRMGQLGGRP